jgi:hypothetical protein
VPANIRTKVPKHLVNLAQALIETKHLRTWFTGLDKLPSAVRVAAFSEMAEQIRRDGHDPILADAVASLTNSKTYHSVLGTVRERVRNAHPAK